MSSTVITGKDIEQIGAVLSPFGVSYAGIDCGHFWKEGIPSICYGPGGETAACIPPDRYTKIEDIMICTKVLALTVLEVLSSD